MQETRIIDARDTYEAQENALAPGSELLDGKLRIERQIGSGGFGITYLVNDVYLDRNVVIKECYSDNLCCRVSGDVGVRSSKNEAQFRTIVDMFMREARSIAKLRHPNIVSVHQVFEENDTAYMVLDLIHGRDLLDIINYDSDVLTPDQVYEMLVKVLDAIDLVHSNDLLHRDISPDNILLDKWGSPTLIDFGAAREEASQKGKEVSALLVVKDGYSPYEFYVSGSKQGPSSDLYALAATLYHLIAGEAPPNSQLRVSEVTSGNDDPFVPLVGRFPGYQRAFLDAIDTALSLSPKDRVQSAKGWLKLIEQDQLKVNKVRIPASRTLSKTLNDLVIETNKEVDRSLPQKLEKIKAKPQSCHEEVFQPVWLEEFNQETSEIAKRRIEERRIAEEAKRLAEERRAAEEQRLAREAEEVEQRALDKEDAKPKSNILSWISRN